MATTQISVEEMTALSSLYSSTTGDSWRWRPELTDGPIWNFTLDAAGEYADNPCDNLLEGSRSWQGVTCSHLPLVCSSQACHIVAINLVDYELTGPLPSDIGLLQSLERLNLEANALSGRIPEEVGALAALTFLSLTANELSHRIPPELGQLRNLSILELNENALTGHIPTELSSLTSLIYLYLQFTYISGTLPSEIGQLIALEALDCSSTLLTGSIPEEVGRLSALEVLGMYNNQLTGVIPSQLWELTLLAILDLGSNQLTGPGIPVEVSQLTALEILVIQGNHLTSSLPSELTQLTALYLIWTYENQLTGPIPSELGQMTTLEVVYIYYNYLSGPLPSSVGSLQNLREFWLWNNYFSGTLPSEMHGWGKLQSLFMQDNIFTGGLDFAFNRSTQLELINVDISNNRLEGSLSSEIFYLPQLAVLALSVNCFREELPEALCNAKQIEVVSLNGLRAAEGCADRVVVPLTGVKLFNTIGGTVPACVWDLDNLGVLHLTGNGLTGELPQSLPAGTKIFDLSLSHNQMRGTIPQDVLNISSLDLSFNQFSGEYGSRDSYWPDSSLCLEVNRVSGKLPVAELGHMSSGSLSILKGNLFSCSSVPENDAFSEFYVCGSRDLDDALSIFVSVAGVAALIVVAAAFIRAVTVSKSRQLMKWLRSTVDLLYVYMTHIRNLDPGTLSRSTALVNISHLSASLIQVVQCSACLAVVVLTGSLALYMMKLLDGGDVYATHSHTYSWFWTMAYVRGVVPASMILGVWAAAVSACFVRIVLYPPRKVAPGKPQHGAQKSANETRSEEHTFSNVVAYAFNAIIIIVVNTLYIYSTQQSLSFFEQFCVQISLSVFRLVYAAVMQPVLSRSVLDTVENVSFRLILLTINNLWIPCVVTALTSDVCFQGLLIAADAVRTPYTYDTCFRYTYLTENETFCSISGTVDVESAPMVPPFDYSNQCRSVVLTAYIPVFLLGYALQMLLPYVVLALTYVPYSDLAPSARNVLHGIIWPEYWLQVDDEVGENVAIAKSETDILFKARTIFCNDVCNNWLLMLTFGLYSPMLAFAIAISVSTRMSMWVLLVGRFTWHMMGVGNHDSPSDGRIIATCTPTRTPAAITAVREDCLGHIHLAALADAYTPLHEILERSFWLLLWHSAAFTAVVTWDMAADGVERFTFLWIPMIPFGYVFALRCVAFVVHGRGTKMESDLDSAEDASTSTYENDCNTGLSNPMHDML